MKKSIVYLFFLTIFSWLQSCSMGSKYQPPEVALPTHWQNQSATKTVENNAVAWWRDFHDPLLNELIEQKSLCNLSIKAAQARIDAARADYRVAYSQLFPKVSTDLLPPDGTGFGLTQVLALSASLDLDLFGKQRETRRRSKANWEAEQAEHDFALLNLQAEIASTYLDLREAQAKNTLYLDNLRSNQTVLSFLNSKYQSGLVNYLDLAQQESFIAVQQAEKEQNTALITAIIHKLEMLMGSPPGTLRQQLSPSKAIPQMHKRIHLGIPASLLQRRPDILAAERRVAASHANIRVALANLFPQINIGWLLAWQTQTVSNNIATTQNPISTFLGTFNAPLFDLTLHKIVDLRKREKILAVIQYELTVLRALHEVETQYNYYQHFTKSIKQLSLAVKKKKLVLKLAKDLYQKGGSDFNTVLQAEEALNHLEVTYLHHLVSYQQTRIHLYTALGGGYERASGNEPKKPS